jgi:hypothetical protein
VEVEGRVLYGSAAYQKRLLPLHVVYGVRRCRRTHNY